MSDEQPSRGCLFRGIVVLLPLLCGLFVAVWILFSRGVLVRDETGRVQFKEPALYLEEPGHEVTGHHISTTRY